MSATAGESTGPTTRSSVADRLILAFWLSVCALSLLLLGLTIAFHLTTLYDGFFAAPSTRGGC